MSSKINGNSTAAQPRRRGGAPRFNVNRLSNGRFSKQPRLSRFRKAREQRPDLRDVFDDCERFETQLMTLTADARGGQIDLVDAIAIDCAAGWLFVARRADELKLEAGLNADVALDRSIKAATARDKCLTVVKGMQIPKPADVDPFACLTLPRLPTISPAPDGREVSNRDASTGEYGSDTPADRQSSTDAIEVPA